MTNAKVHLRAAYSIRIEEHTEKFKVKNELIPWLVQWLIVPSKKVIYQEEKDGILVSYY